MKTGCKVAAAGLAVVLGCAAVAVSPTSVTWCNDGVAVSVAAQNAQAATDVEESAPTTGAVLGDSQAQVVAGGSLGSSSVNIHRAVEQPDAGEGSPVFQDSASETTYRDGVYRASAQGRQGSVPVTVTISHGIITDIVVGQNVEVAAMAEKAQETVIPQILATQSTADIDVATGATLTSEAIIAAVASALSRAAV